MKKLILLFLISAFSLLFAADYKFSTDLHINKVLRASVNQMNFIFIYEENSDFKMFIGENDGFDYLFVDKESVKALNKFVEEINNKADRKQNVKEISIYDFGWSFTYDDCTITLKKTYHFVFEKLKGYMSD